MMNSKLLISVIAAAVIGLFFAKIAHASGSSYAPSDAYYAVEAKCPNFSAELKYTNSWTRKGMKLSLTKIILKVDGKNKTTDISSLALPKRIPVIEGIAIQRVLPSCFEKEAISFAVFVSDSANAVSVKTAEGVISRFYLNVYKNGNVKLSN